MSRVRMSGYGRPGKRVGHGDRPRRPIPLMCALLHVAFLNGMERHATDTVTEHVAVDIAFNLVTGHAFHVAAVRTHMHVEFARRASHCQRDVAMFDVVAAARKRVAVDAIFDRRLAAVHSNALCNRSEIDSRYW